MTIYRKQYGGLRGINKLMILEILNQFLDILYEKCI